jgi:hypothetical protein
MLYHTVLDGICVVLFLDKLDSTDIDDVSLPNFTEMSSCDKIRWLNDLCEEIIVKWFFADKEDVMEELRNDLQDVQKNYWTAAFNDGRFKCHHCEKDYKRVSSLKAHESEKHNVSLSRTKKGKQSPSDELQDYVLMLFKLVMLHKNFDDGVDMGDGGRCVRSAKYELPIYHKTQKIKYSICSIHTTALSSGLLTRAVQG